jgi:hypothetical protein
MSNSTTFTVANLVASPGEAVVPMAYNGPVIDTLILIPDECWDGSYDYSVVYYGDDGEEYCLDGIPFGAYWNAEVLSDLSFHDTAYWLWEDIGFYQDEMHGMEAVAAAGEAARLDLM